MTNTSITSESIDLAEPLAPYGIAYQDAMARMLNNGALFKQLAMHYLNDTNYEALVKDMSVADYETGYQHAHTLKGVSGNLSFGRLHQLATQICDALSGGDADAASGLMDELGDAHRRVYEGLEYWQGVDA